MENDPKISDFNNNTEKNLSNILEKSMSSSDDECISSVSENEEYDWKYRVQRRKEIEKEAPLVEFFLNVKEKQCMKVIYLKDGCKTDDINQIQYYDEKNKRMYICLNCDSYGNYDFTASSDPFIHDVGYKCLLIKKGWEKLRSFYDVVDILYPDRLRVFPKGAFYLDGFGTITSL